MDIDQKITWKRGQLSVRDSFSYLPEGNFGGSMVRWARRGSRRSGDTSFGIFLAAAAWGPWDWPRAS